MVLPSSASNGTRLCDFPFSADSWCCRNDGLRFLTQHAEWLCSANHGSIRDFSPIAFSGCPRGHRVSRKTWCPKHAQPNGVMDTHLKGGVKLDHWGGGKLDQMSVQDMGIGQEGGVWSGGLRSGVRTAF